MKDDESRMPLPWIGRFVAPLSAAPPISTTLGSPRAAARLKQER
jgi:hypothetical protein